MTPTIVVITGASGAGKTASVRALAARNLPGVSCYYFDADGVPSPEEMEKFPENWQAMKTREWLTRLASDPDGAEVYILDGQVRPSFVYEAAEQTLAKAPHIILLDCTPSVRHTRLRELRQQPELVTTQMDCWAAYLRGQADALKLPVIDTTNVEISDVADSLVAIIESLCEPQRHATSYAWKQ